MSGHPLAGAADRGQDTVRSAPPSTAPPAAAPEPSDTEEDVSWFFDAEVAETLTGPVVEVLRSEELQEAMCGGFAHMFDNQATWMFLDVLCLKYVFGWYFGTSFLLGEIWTELWSFIGPWVTRTSGHPWSFPASLQAVGAASPEPPTDDDAVACLIAELRQGGGATMSAMAQSGSGRGQQCFVWLGQC